MEKFDKLKEASSSLGERLKTSGAQMGRMVSSKMKEILQGPTRESKIVDEATSETMEDPDWGLNLRICSMINGEELSGTEVVKAIKKKLNGKSPVSQRLSLDLLETCTSNCDKVFSEVASEKVLDDMVMMIDDPSTDNGNSRRAYQLIRAWGESEDLEYLPVFRQAYMSLKTRKTFPGAQDGAIPPMQQTLGSYMDQQLMSTPEGYPVPEAGLHGADDGASLNSYNNQSTEENREFLVVTRNSLDLLSSILNSEIEPKQIEDDLTVSLLEKCKDSQLAVQRIVESTLNDEAILFEALNLHEELQQVISKYNEMEAAASSKGVVKVKSDTDPRSQVNNGGESKTADSSNKAESTNIGRESQMAGSLKEESAQSGTGKTG